MNIIRADAVRNLGAACRHGGWRVGALAPAGSLDVVGWTWSASGALATGCWHQGPEDPGGTSRRSLAACQPSGDPSQALGVPDIVGHEGDPDAIQLGIDPVDLLEVARLLVPALLQEGVPGPFR